jgi:hypothetical protein
MDGWMGGWVDGGTNPVAAESSAHPARRTNELSGVVASQKNKKRRLVKMAAGSRRCDALASLSFLYLVVDPSVPEVAPEDGSEAGERRPTPNILPPAEFILKF